MAKVSPAAINKALARELGAATDGKKINVGHRTAVKYLKDHLLEGSESPAIGIDPLYEDAIKLCNLKKRFTATTIRDGLKIGGVRAKKIYAMMVAVGTNKPIPPPPPLNKKTAINNLPTEPSDSIIFEIPEDIQAFADMTLREIIKRFGTDVAFLEWLRAIKSIEDINEKRLKNAKTKGELVSRELMKVGVIDPYNQAHLQLLTDGSKTIARRVMAMAGADRTVEECEKFIADQITSFIRPVKTKVGRALKNA